ncbi:MAG TPA: hypothetical protein VNC16_11460 [Solirubrobacterales bacterium]|nr:hypothetical protein [Solirubrobacterales bacterium]
MSGEGGTLLEQSDGERKSEERALQKALAEPEPKAEERAPALATEIDEAAEATTKIEQAAALCKGAAEGPLDPDQLALEVGTLLDCLERLDRTKKHKKAIQLARSLSTLLMLLKRWASLLQTLRIALRAGQEVGDETAVAWAKHELGTLRLAADDLGGADDCLRQAREIRERIGDSRGLAATNRNMQTLCDRLRAKLRNEAPAPGGQRSIWPPTPSLIVLFAVLFGVGVAAGILVADDPAQQPVAETRSDRDPGHDRTTTVTTTGTPETVTTVETVTSTVTEKVGGEDTGGGGVIQREVEDESAAGEEEEEEEAGSSP